jgi:hypothetical protein
LSVVSSNLTPEQRSLRARLAAHDSWARTVDRKARTAKARKARLHRIVAEVDPDGTLSPEVRAQMVQSRLRADMARLAFLSSKARARRR